VLLVEEVVVVIQRMREQMADLAAGDQLEPVEVQDLLEIMVVHL
jgi:hypothetical protein